AVNAFASELFRGTYPFPRGGELNQDAFPRNTGLFVITDQLPGLGHGTFDIKTEAGIYFGRDSVRNDFEDFHAEPDGEVVHGKSDALVGRQGAPFGFRLDTLQDLLVLRHLRRFEEQAWVGGSVAWFVASNALKIAGVGYNETELLQL